MPKKKRTRKEKMQADVRRQATTAVSHTAAAAPSITRKAKERSTVEETPTGTFSLPKEYTSLSNTKPTMHQVASTKTLAIDTNAYNYLRGDLLKTLGLTTFIVIAEVVIYFFMMQ